MLADAPDSLIASEVDANGCPSLARRPYRRDRVRRRRKREAEESAAEFHPHHARDVPRQVDLSSAVSCDSSGTGTQNVTTMMLKHIPCRYTQGTLLREIDVSGFEGSYDFFYLPMDVRNKTSVGYCFINFLAPEDATRFAEVFGAHEFQRHRSDKIGEVSPAKIQGLRNNLEHFSGRAVVSARDGKRRPIVLQNGFRRDFCEVLAELSMEAQPCLRTNAAPLNPMAAEFVPGRVQAFNPSAEEFVPQGSQKRTRANSPHVELGEAFKGARTDLEVAVCRLLEKAVPGVAADANVQHSGGDVFATAPRKEFRSEILTPETPKTAPEDADAASRHSAAQMPAQEAGGSSWVADAFEHLVDELVGDLTPRKTLKDGAIGSSWVFEALRAIAAGSYAGRRPNGTEQYWQEPTSTEGGWVADAFKALIAGAVKKPSGKIMVEDFVPTSTASTPRLADTVQNLRSFGGWAWIAFA